MQGKRNLEQKQKPEDEATPPVNHTAQVKIKHHSERKCKDGSTSHV